MQVPPSLYSVPLTSSSRVRPSVREGITAVLYFVYLNVINYAFGWYEDGWVQNFRNLGWNEDWALVAVGLPMAALQLAPLLLILMRRGESPGSVGLRRSRMKRSLGLGVLGALPFALITIIGMHGLYLQGSPVPGFLYFFALIALPEELIFRGYIQTRITGLVRSKFAAVVVTGLLFSLMHIPFQLSAHGMTYSGYLLQMYPHLLMVFGMHFYFTYLYTRTNNIWGTVLCHALIDFIG